MPPICYTRWRTQKNVTKDEASRPCRWRGSRGIAVSHSQSTMHGRDARDTTSSLDDQTNVRLSEFPPCPSLLDLRVSAMPPSPISKFAPLPLKLPRLTTVSYTHLRAHETG